MLYDLHSQSPIPVWTAFKMYCCLAPNVANLPASANGAGQAAGVQHVPGPLHIDAFGHSQVCMGPRHILGFSLAITSSLGAVAFMPFNNPIAFPLISSDACSCGVMERVHAGYATVPDTATANIHTTLHPHISPGTIRLQMRVPVPTPFAQKFTS